MCGAACRDAVLSDAIALDAPAKQRPCMPDLLAFDASRLRRLDDRGSCDADDTRRFRDAHDLLGRNALDTWVGRKHSLSDSNAVDDVFGHTWDHIHLND